MIQSKSQSKVQQHFTLTTEISDFERVSKCFFMFHVFLFKSLSYYQLLKICLILHMLLSILRPRQIEWKLYLYNEPILQCFHIRNYIEDVSRLHIYCKNFSWNLCSCDECSKNITFEFFKIVFLKNINKC